MAVLVLLLTRLDRGSGGPTAYERRPVGVMGTGCTLVAVAEGAGAAGAALDRAEGELRRMEAVFSRWIEASEVSRLNAAAAGELEVSREMARLLAAARRLHRETRGAFDVTAGPLFALWRRAAERGSPPGPRELAAARAASRWEALELAGRRVRKLGETVVVELDGIAKGYAVDRALEALLGVPGVVGGMVEVGGDLRVAGRAPAGDAWPVAVRDPGAWEGTPAGASDRVLDRLAVRDRAVCTSGDYARFVEIAGRRYARIVDPRSGRPVERVRSATVLAPDALTADAWATALAVLGPDGLELLPAGIEALLLERGGGRAATPGWGSSSHDPPP